MIRITDLRRLSGRVGGIAVGSLVAALVALAPPVRAQTPTPESVYRDACATCHGHDGTGAPRSQVAFEEPLPDFTDCGFATREPDADWLAVAHDGGPARGFATMMPALGEALTRREIMLALERIRGFCPDDAWPRGELNLPRAMVTEKAYPEDEAVFTASSSVEGPTTAMFELVYERRFGARNQVELVVPFGWREQEGVESAGDDWTGALGDVAVGVKRAFFHSLERGTIVSATAELKLPTGDDEKGFGAGTPRFEPFVSFGQILPADAFLHAQAGLELPFDTDRATEEGFWRAAIGRSFTRGMFGRVWSPMIEVLGARELTAGESVQWDVLPQLQVTLNTRQHVMANVGVRIPVTEAGDRDTEVLVYVLWDWFDGGFLEGW